MNNEPLKTEDSSPHESPHRQPWFWIVGGLLFLAVSAAAYLQYSRAEEGRSGRMRITRSAPPAVDLPVLGQLPAFSLMDRAGIPISLKELSGKVWLANFIFTTCGGPCPIMTNRMRILREELQKQGLDNIFSVSITVDPERDTPKVLSDYASLKKAESNHWLFLTGSPKAIRDLCVEGFMLPVEEGEGDHQILHSPRFILVDGKGRIRGYYDIVGEEEMEMPRGEVFDKPMDPEVQKKIIADIRALLTADAAS